MNFYIGIRAGVALVGFVVYFAASKPETKEVGRLGFFAGLFALLLALPTHA